jgi:hypothetical protein
MSAALLVAVICFEKEKYLTAGLLSSIAIFSKQLAVMPIFAIIVCYIISRKYKSIMHFTVGFSASSILILSPFILTGNLVGYLHSQSQASVHTMFSANYPNFPWLVGVFYKILQSGFHTDFSALTSPTTIQQNSMREAAYLGFSCVSLLIILIWAAKWKSWDVENEISPAFSATTGIFAYSYMSFGVHENHVYMILPLLLLISCHMNSIKIYALVSMLICINWLFLFGLGNSFPILIGINTTFPQLYFYFSIIFFILNTYAFKLFFKIPPRLMTSHQQNQNMDNIA